MENAIKLWFGNNSDFVSAMECEAYCNELNTNIRQSKYFFSV